MGLVSGIIVYCCLWWVIFFMALPFGVEREVSLEPGNDAGAPKKPYLLRKTLGTTAVATLCWFGINYIIGLYAP